MKISLSSTFLLSFLVGSSSGQSLHGNDERTLAVAYECALPTGAADFSLVTREDASIGAHSMCKGVAVGGELTDGSPNESGTVDQTRSYVGSLNANANFNFNGDLSENVDLNTVIDFDHFQWLAEHAESSQSGNQKVVVLTSGGTFNMYDFVNGGQAYDNGNTLDIFNTADEVRITKTQDGRDKWAANLWVWNTPRHGYPNNPKNPKFKPKGKSKSKKPTTETSTAFKAITVTFTNSGTDPLYDNAELFFENKFWGKLGPSDPPISMTSYKSHMWNVRVDGKLVHSWTIESDEDEQQDFTI